MSEMNEPTHINSTIEKILIEMAADDPMLADEIRRSCSFMSRLDESEILDDMKAKELLPCRPDGRAGKMEG